MRPLTAYPAPHVNRGFPSDRLGNRWEFLIVVGWLGVITLQFPGDELLLYPLMLAIMGISWLARQEIIEMLKRAPLVMAMPLFYFLSSQIWAIDSAFAFKASWQLGLTMLTCVYMATRFSRRQIILALMLGMVVFGVLSFLVILTQGGDKGLFVTKQQLGKRMGLLLFASLAIFLDVAWPRWLRWAAGGVALMAAFLVKASASATSIMLSGAGAAALIGVALMWRPATRLPGGRALMILGGIILASLGFAALTMVISQEQLVDSVLELFGKDRTLTLRTELWLYARELSENNYWLGTGPGGFWRWGNADAYAILDSHGRDRGGNYNFHSAWWEMAIHVGRVGAVLGGLILLWAASSVILGWIRRQDVAATFFLAAGAVMVMRTFTESDLFQFFELQHMVLWMGAMFAVRDINPLPPPSQLLKPKPERPELGKIRRPASSTAPPPAS